MRFLGIRADVAADKLVRVCKIISDRIHPEKLKFAAEKSELDLRPGRLSLNFWKIQPLWLARKNRHN
jgi:hypothetical protein